MNDLNKIAYIANFFSKEHNRLESVQKNIERLYYSLDAQGQKNLEDLFQEFSRLISDTRSTLSGLGSLAIQNWKSLPSKKEKEAGNE